MTAIQPVSTATPAATEVPTAATPQQLGSTLRLRVAFGGLPARDVTAALLHRDEIADSSLTEGKERFVLALLKGWDEGQLRSNDARLIVYRNKVNTRGETESIPFPAALVQLDPATGLGVVTYVDTFDYASDVGFHLQRADDPARANLLLLRTVQESNGGTGFTPPSPALPRSPMAGAMQFRTRGEAGRFSIDVGAYLGANGGPPQVNMPAKPSSESADPVALAVAGPDDLHGFVETTPHGPVITGLKGFAFAAKFPSYEVTHVDFEDAHTPDRYEITLTVVPESNGPAPRQLRLRARATTDAARGKWPSPGTATPPVTDAFDLQLYSGPSPGWRGSLPTPSEGQDQVYEMQLSWPLLPGRDGLEIYGRPFRIRIEHRVGGLFPTVLDPLPGNDGQQTETPSDNGSLDAPATGVATFPLEAAAVDVHLVRGGREALIHLDNAPYWKRFSFEKNDWLPLPDTTGDRALTGNLNALFVLNRELHEVRKYRLPDLEPAGTATLPPGEYTTILAGCDSEHAPVHLVAGSHLMSLDADTLQRRDILPSADDNAGPGFPSFMPQGADHFFTTGDGLAIVRLRDGTGDVLHYNGDARGFERTYLGLDGAGFSNEVPGVTAGWSVGDGVRCLDNPDRTSTSQSKLADPWKFTRAVLAENAPVVIRLRRPSSNELPPRIKLGCFAMFGTVPFAEMDAPELAGLLQNGQWTRDHWAFIDPYSHQLATLSQDRRTWSVRKLEFVNEHAAPALLNWPDTTLQPGSVWTFHPVLTSDSPLEAKLLGKKNPPTLDPATGTISLPVPAVTPETLQLLNLQLSVPDTTAGFYPVLLHSEGLETPFAVSPATKLAGTGQHETGLASLGVSRPYFYPLKATLLRFPDRVKTIVGPVAGHAALVMESGRVDFLSVETRQTAGSFIGSNDAAYYTGPDALLEYDPTRRTLTRIGVPNGRREQALTLPANIKLTGVGAGTERGSPVALAVAVSIREGSMGLADLALPKKPIMMGNGFDTVVLLDGATFKAGTRAQPISLSRLLGKPESFGDEFANLIGVADSPPVLLPGSRDGSVYNLAGCLLANSPSHALAYPHAQKAGAASLASERGGLAGGSLTGMMAFSGGGQGYKGGEPVLNNVMGARDLGATPDGRYNFHLLNANPNDAGVEVSSAENNRPLLRLGQLVLAEQQTAIGGDRFIRRVWMLGDHGPLAVLGQSGRAMELVDLDVPVVAQQVNPQDFHVVTQPLPYVMEGQVFQYTVRVNNPAAVLSMRILNPIGASLSPLGTVSVTAPNNISAPTYLNIAIEIKGKNGQTLLHEFPVCVLPTPRGGTSRKIGEL